MAVFQETPSPSATRATVRCCTTRPSSAHRSPRRDSFARGSAARLVSCRHTCPHSRAAVAAHGDVQAGRPPAERLVRQPADHGAARDALAAAAVAPVVGVDDPAREHGTIGVEALPGHDEPELVEAAEHGQVRAAEAGIRGSVVQRRGLP